MIERQKRNPGDSEAIGVIEDVVGCKWSLAVLMRIRAGVHRPGELERAVAGVSKKVLNERLRKLQRHGILEKRVFAEVPPRVEYRITALGERFGALLDQLAALQREWQGP
jgi:DNA-binding HxlR family transcriptional regulator